MQRERERWIDALRGFGIVWVVLGHSIERTITSIGYTNFYMHFFDVFANSIHIYILFLVSGYVYALVDRPQMITSLNVPIKKKMIDLLLPYIWFGILIWIGKFIFSKFVAKPVGYNDLIQMFITPIAFAWYLYVLFIIIIIVSIIDFITNNKYYPLFFFSLFFIVAQIYFNPQNVTLLKTLHNFPIFVLGMYIANNKDLLKGKWKVIICFLLFGSLTYFHFIYDNVWVLLDFSTHITGAYFFAILIYQISEKIKISLLIKIGENTLYIYLLHPIFINSLKAIYNINNVINVGVWIFSLFVFGITMPMLYALFAHKYVIFDFLFRPRKYIKTIH